MRAHHPPGCCRSCTGAILAAPAWGPVQSVTSTASRPFQGAADEPRVHRLTAGAAREPGDRRPRGGHGVAAVVAAAACGNSSALGRTRTMSASTQHANSGGATARSSSRSRSRSMPTPVDHPEAAPLKINIVELPGNLRDRQLQNTCSGSPSAIGRGVSTCRRARQWSDGQWSSCVGVLRQSTTAAQRVPGAAVGARGGLERGCTPPGSGPDPGDDPRSRARRRCRRQRLSRIGADQRLQLAEHVPTAGGVPFTTVVGPAAVHAVRQPTERARPLDRFPHRGHGPRSTMTCLSAVVGAEPEPHHPNRARPRGRSRIDDEAPARTQADAAWPPLHPHRED